jgi:hypothetical protein
VLSDDVGVDVTLVDVEHPTQPMREARRFQQRSIPRTRLDGRTERSKAMRVSTSTGFVATIATALGATSSSWPAVPTWPAPSTPTVKGRLIGIGRKGTERAAGTRD